MAYLTEHLCFYAMPRTGSTWVLQAMRHALGRENVTVNDAHDTPLDCRVDPDGRMTMVLLRNPWHWMRSWYQWQVEHSWTGMLGCTTILERCRENTFERFIDTYLDVMPGSVSTFYAMYTEGCDRVGTTECAAEYLCDALSSSGHTFNPLSIMTYPPANTSSGKVAQTMLWTPEQAKQFAQVDDAAFILWGKEQLCQSL